MTPYIKKTLNKLIGQFLNQWIHKNHEKLQNKTQPGKNCFKPVRQLADIDYSMQWQNKHNADFTCTSKVISLSSGSCWYHWSWSRIPRWLETEVTMRLDHSHCPHLCQLTAGAWTAAWSHNTQRSKYSPVQYNSLRSPNSNSAGPEINEPVRERSNRHGSESSTLEIDVYVWRYALIVMHARNERTNEF